MPVASPDYLGARGAPAHPEELSRHTLIQFERKGREQWVLRRGGAVATVPLASQIVTNHTEAVRAFAVSGEGVALLPAFFCRNEFKAGKLVRILPDWAGETDPVSLVYPAQRFVAAKTRAFLDFATKPLAAVFTTDIT